MNLPLVATDVVQFIYKNYETEFNRQFRPHLGASMGGDPCARKLFYNFRHAIFVDHDGRILRLFQRGHKEEFTFQDELNKAGFNVITQDPSGKQFRLGTDRNKHVSGSGDGFAQVLQASEFFDLNEWLVVEMKTHNNKSFIKLQKEGVRVSKPLHYTQMQLYMKWSKLAKALYIAVNKDTDELYIECIPFDLAHAQEKEDRMVHVAESTSIPVKLHDDPSRFECKFCDYYSICHQDKFPLNVTCRNCAYVVPNSDGTWTCNKENITALDPNLIAIGCAHHIFHPDFLESIATASSTCSEHNYIEYEFLNGLKLKNGTAAGDVLDSLTFAAIVTNGYEAVDENVQALIEQFDAKLLGGNHE